MQHEQSFEEIIEKIYNGESALSFSSLKAFSNSPKHFKEYKTDRTETEAMREGTAFHMAVLEPEKFKKEYWVLDDSEKIKELLESGAKNPRATKVYKLWKAEQEENNSGKMQLSKELYDSIVRMSEYLRTNSATKHLLKGLKETEKDFLIEIDGAKVRGVIDGIGSNYNIDLKKVADASFKKVKWIIYDMLYHVQGAIYNAASPKEKYFLIFIDKGCNVTVVNVSKDTLQSGYETAKTLIQEFMRACEEDAWNGSYEFYNNGFVVI